jgi:TRAP-type C4-dicarboxylate transport system substrate-binding protein
MLNPILFEKRCERDVWNTHTTTERHKSSRHFLALYNVVVAVGALVAGRTVLEDLGPEVQAYIAELAELGTLERRVSSQTISRTYFRKSKDRLGDTSAVCSLESAQTLLLMVGTPQDVCKFSC